MRNRSIVTIFAYGSNMCVPRLRARVSSAVPLGVGYVSQHQFAFHKRSVDGSAKANALFTGIATDHVWGVIYKLRKADWPVLDECEFLGIGYNRTVVDVCYRQRMIQAWMYVARADAIDTTLLPYSWYQDFVLHGAQQHGLPSSYLNRLQQFRSLPDPDRQRQQINERLIQIHR